VELISVIIPVLNRADLIGRQLEALATQDIDRPFEVIVADNGSTDDSLAVAISYADRFHRFRTVDALTRPGGPGARNAAIAVADGDVLAFCDSDDAAHTTWLRELVAALDGHDDGFVAGCLVYAYEGEPRPTPETWDTPTPRSDQLGYLAFADTASLAIRADVFRRLGGFDEQFRRCADIELSFRLQTAGMRLVDAPLAVMLKYQPATKRGWWRKRYEWGTFHALLYRRYRTHGMPRATLGEAAVAWAKLATRCLLMWIPRQRTLLVRTSPHLVGHLAGSIRWRVRYL
jgi:GT2 family glycosyltransferase